MSTTKKILITGSIALGVIAAVNLLKRTPAPGLIAKVPLVGPLAAVAVFG